jgi:hypothetical protein
MTTETIAAPVAVDFTRLKIAGAFFGGMALAFTLTFAFPNKELDIDRMYRKCVVGFSAYAPGAIDKCFVQSMADYVIKYRFR